jgi:hypothetical protein
MNLSRASETCRRRRIHAYADSDVFQHISWSRTEPRPLYSDRQVCPDMLSPPLSSPYAIGQSMSSLSSSRQANITEFSLMHTPCRYDGSIKLKIMMQRRHSRTASSKPDTSSRASIFSECSTLLPFNTTYIPSRNLSARYGQYRKKSAWNQTIFSEYWMDGSIE